MRRAAKKDRNHPEVVDALRAAGCGVVDLGALGDGIPDLLVCEPVWPHNALLMEVKDGAKPPSACKLKPAQVEFHRTWKGRKCIVKDVAEALAAVGIGARVAVLGGSGPP